MAVFCFRKRIAICFHLLFVWHVCFASAIELPSKHSQNKGGLSAVKRAEGTKTFEISFNITISYGEIYGFNCSIGTPPQNVQLGINVFRSDTQVSMNITKNPWATAYNSTLSTSANPYLEYSELIFNAVPDFEAPNSNLYDINYVDVFYATDSFTIPSTSNTTATLKDVPLVAYSNVTSNDNRVNTGRLHDYDYNWIGLGLPSGQAIVQLEPPSGRPYPTFAQHFINASFIESNTYSIWLDPLANQTGHLLLGGINSFHYKDSLASLPTVLNATSDSYGLRFQTVLTCSIDSLSINNTPLPATNISHIVLAHSPDTLLEAKVARAVWDAVGATYNTAYPLDQITPSVPCSYLTNSSTVDIKFSGANFTLSVPLSYITAKGGQGALGDSGASIDTCILRIKAVGIGLPSMLGTGVMRNLYTVYDLENSILSIALTDFEAAGGEDNVITIPKGGVAAIAKDLFKSKPSATSGGGASNTASSTPANTTSPGEQGTGGSRNRVAIGVGVAVPTIAIIAFAAAFLLFRRRRKARKQEAIVKMEGSDDTQHGKAELADDQKAVGAKELADDQKVKGELLGNLVHKVSGGENLGMYELPARAMRHELA